MTDGPWHYRQLHSDVKAAEKKAKRKAEGKPDLDQRGPNDTGSDAGGVFFFAISMVAVASMLIWFATAFPVLTGVILVAIFLNWLR